MFIAASVRYCLTLPYFAECTFGGLHLATMENQPKLQLQ
jgi:hypothetical protein